MGLSATPMTHLGSREFPGQAERPAAPPRSHRWLVTRRIASRSRGVASRAGLGPGLGTRAGTRRSPVPRPALAPECSQRDAPRPRIRNRVVLCCVVLWLSAERGNRQRRDIMYIFIPLVARTGLIHYRM